METKSNRLVVTFVTVIMLLASSTPAGAQTSRTPQATVQLAPDVQHAAGFVRFLQEAQIPVQEVLRSHFEAMFTGVHTAAFVRTEFGVVEIVILPGATDAEEISITYTRNTSRGIRHHYVLKGPFLPAEGEHMDAASPFYFTLHKNLVCPDRGTSSRRTAQARPWPDQSSCTAMICSLMMPG